MDADRWRDIEAAFAAALTCQGEARADYLRQLRLRDRRLYQEVVSLLSADESADDFLDHMLSASLTSLQGVDRDPWIGRRLGVYRLVSLIGRGGMSRVYLARRDDGLVDQQVAVKLVGVGLDSTTQMRLRSERQILARLDHPNIARFYDAGETAAGGLPYFAMEYVAGHPIDAFCDARTYSLRQRLRLFVRVCRAVGAAHRNLVVHRDLKPGNILVTDDGQPKLLDFGIAKLVAADGHWSQGVTATGERPPMTYAYASPEQIRGEAVTTAADVYALGVILYRLVTGRRPYPMDSVRDAGHVADQREVPKASSAAVDGDVATTHGCSPKRLRRQLRGDLERIVAKAMHPDVRHRYAAVEQFADDIEHHLCGRPVSARPHTLFYRMQRLVRRNPWATAAASALVVVLIAFAVHASLNAARLKTERDRAQQVATMLSDLFAIADPSEMRGNSITGRELLDHGAEKVRALEGQPETRALLMDKLGGLYYRLGLYESAIGMYRESSTAWLALHGDHHARSLDSLNNLAAVLAEQGHFQEASQYFARSLRARIDLYGEEHAAVAQATNNLALVYHDLGRYDQAEPLYRRAVAMDRKLLGPDHRHTLIDESNLALLLADRGQYEEAEANLRAILARMDARGIVEGRASYQGILANVRRAQGAYREAEHLGRAVLAHHRSEYGEKHPFIARAIRDLGMTLLWQKRYDEAETYLREALAIRQERLGDDHQEVADSMTALAQLAFQQGDLVGAKKLVEEAVELEARRLPAEHPLRGVALLLRGEIALAELQPEQARTWLQKGLALLPPKDWRAQKARQQLKGITTEPAAP